MLQIAPGIAVPASEESHPARQLHSRSGGRPAIDAHIKLGNLVIKPQLLEFFHRINNIENRRVINAEMCLMADTVNRNTFTQHLFHQIIKTVPLLRIIRSIIVNIQLNPRSARLPRSTEGCRNIIGSRDPPDPIGNATLPRLDKAGFIAFSATIILFYSLSCSCGAADSV